MRSTRRDEILAHAAKLFSERGIAATTVRDIADEVGILSGSLYHYFDSKDAIANEIVVRFLEDLNVRYEDSIEPEGSARNRLAHDGVGVFCLGGGSPVCHGGLSGRSHTFVATGGRAHHHPGSEGTQLLAIGYRSRNCRRGVSGMTSIPNSFTVSCVNPSGPPSRSIARSFPNWPKICSAI